MKTNKYRFISKHEKPKPKPPQPPTNDNLCPTSVTFAFDPIKSTDTRFHNKLFLIVWSCIKYRHITNQYFNDQVEEFVKNIKHVKSYQEFKNAANYSPLRQFGTNNGIPLDTFWKQVWEYVFHYLYPNDNNLFPRNEKLKMTVKLEWELK